MHRLAAICLLLAWHSATLGIELVLDDVQGLPSERASLAVAEDAAIGYATQPTTDVVASLNRRLAAGAQSLAFSADQGYLPAVLEALGVARNTQLLAFSRTSLQRQYIEASNPRALYFNDTVAVAFIRGAPLLELAALDPEQGVVFYTIEQRASEQPRAIRQQSCLSCHVSRNSMDVPGMLVRSVATAPNGKLFPQLVNSVTDHRTVFEERWAGWYVTGGLGKALHLGNLLVDPASPTSLVPTSQSLQSLAGRLDSRGYTTSFSDVAAHLVFEHQMHMSNLLTRMGWETRVLLTSTSADGAVAKTLLANDARELVDYLLFVDEAMLPGPVLPSNDFAADFAARGPRDTEGRSLRELDLQTRLLRYRCSYLIYSAAFDALPSPARQAIYRRMWAILSGQEAGAQYRRLPAEERRAIIEILRDTKPGLPDFFR